MLCGKHYCHLRKYKGRKVKYYRGRILPAKICLVSNSALSEEIAHFTIYHHLIQVIVDIQLIGRKGLIQISDF